MCDITSLGSSGEKPRPSRGAALIFRVTPEPNGGQPLHNTRRRTPPLSDFASTRGDLHSRRAVWEPPRLPGSPRPGVEVSPQCLRLDERMRLALVGGLSRREHIEALPTRLGARRMETGFSRARRCSDAARGLAFTSCLNQSHSIGGCPDATGWGGTLTSVPPPNRAIIPYQAQSNSLSPSAQNGHRTSRLSHAV